MGQKVNPIGFRVAIDKQWRSRWFSGKKDFGDLLAEDTMIREAVLKELKQAAVSKLEIERYAKNVRINIFTARPAFIVGAKSAVDMNKIAASLAKKTGKKIYFDIREERDAERGAFFRIERRHFASEDVRLNLTPERAPGSAAGRANFVDRNAETAENVEKGIERP